MPRQKRELSDAQRAALAKGTARIAELRAAGILKSGGKGGGAHRTDAPPERDGPRAVVVAEPEAPAAPPAPESKARRITWPTPPTPTNVEPATESADATARPDVEREPGSERSTITPASPPPPASPRPRSGFLAGLLEGFRE